MEVAENCQQEANILSSVNSLDERQTLERWNRDARSCRLDSRVEKEKIATFTCLEILEVGETTHEGHEFRCRAEAGNQAKLFH